MKYQQVSVDFANMVYTACSYLALAAAAWIFLRLLQACFSLPRHLKKQNDVQSMLQEKLDTYERYLRECEEKEKQIESGETTDDADDGKTSIGNADGLNNEEKWKERRECLEMLKRELNRVRDGGNVYDWDYLLEEDEKPEEATAEAASGDDTKKKDVSPNDVDCDIVDNTKEETEPEDKKEK